MSLLRVQRHNNYAVVALKREPVNSLNTELWEQLKAVLDELEDDAAIRGLIFTSGLARPVFTAGKPFRLIHWQSESHL